MIGNFLGNVEKPHSYVKTTFSMLLLGQLLEKGYFLLQHLVTLMLTSS